MPIPNQRPVQPRLSLREVAQSQIRDAILNGTFQPGELLNDNDLQRWLGVSRTPIREALNDLARVGLVQMVPQRYTRVAVPVPEERLAILQTLGAILGGVARVSVGTLDAAQRAGMSQAIDVVLDAVSARDTEAFGRENWALMMWFVKACPNPVLAAAARDLVDGLGYRLAISRTSETTRWEQLEVEFPRLRDAVQRGDAVAAELAIEGLFRLADGQQGDGR